MAGQSRSSSPSERSQGDSRTSDVRRVVRDASLHSVRLPASVGETDVASFLVALDARLERKERFALVIELDDALAMSAAVRRKLAVALEERNAASKVHCAAIAIVARTPAALGVHTAIRWLTDAPCPERVFSVGVDAEAWARGRLAGEGGGA